MTVASKIYENQYLKPLFDAQAERLIRQMQVEDNTIDLQSQSTSSYSLYFKLLPTVFVHLGKLIKNILLLLGTAVLALVAFFSDRAVFKQLAIAMKIDVKLIFKNVHNLVLALFSPLINAIRDITQASDEDSSNEESLPSATVDQFRIRSAYDGIFFKREDYLSESEQTKGYQLSLKSYDNMEIASTDYEFDGSVVSFRR